MANTLKLWKGADEPAESGASGNQYKAWKGAVEPAASITPPSGAVGFVSDVSRDLVRDLVRDVVS